jgi:hypothetical protein
MAMGAYNMYRRSHGNLQLSIGRYMGLLVSNSSHNNGTDGAKCGDISTTIEDTARPPSLGGLNYTV